MHVSESVIQYLTFLKFFSVNIQIKLQLLGCASVIMTSGRLRTMQSRISFYDLPNAGGKRNYVLHHLNNKYTFVTYAVTVIQIFSTYEGLFHCYTYNILGQRLHSMARGPLVGLDPFRSGL
jgi:hypothetical protein